MRELALAAASKASAALLDALERRARISLRRAINPSSNATHSASNLPEFHFVLYIYSFIFV